MKLSVIVINYKSRSIINRCLNSIQTKYPYEILVVDNDNDLPPIDRNDITIIPFSGNLGFSGANNKAIHNSSGEFILFLNADAFLDREYIDRCILFLEAHPNCSSAQGKLLKESNPDLIDSTGNVVTSSFWAFNEHHLDPNHHIPPHEIFGVCCAAGLFRRSMLEEVREGDEYFDEDFFAYLEDVDLNIRLRKMGYSSWCDSGVAALHIREASSSWLFRIRQSLFNRYLLILKHSPSTKRHLYELIWLPLILIMIIPDLKHGIAKIRACHSKGKKYYNMTLPSSIFDRENAFRRHIQKRVLAYFHRDN